MKYWLALCIALLLFALPAMADDGVMRDDLTAVEVTRLMGNGTNLGNTMEACDTSKMCWSDDPSVYEISWGQPKTTREMIQGLKAAGFDTLRIPVAWMTNATKLYPDGDYTINEAYLARVGEIVDWARDAGMYVIINDHWDGGWWGMFGSENPDTVALAKEAYAGMWRQIAEYFRDYSDYVIFEGANEEIGARFDENSKYCQDSVTTYLTDAQRYALTNEVNQLFVDTVRSTGGNNATRFLLIPGYGTNIASTCDSRFVMPKDSADHKLLISVHYYDPWSYCGASDAAGATKWGTKQHMADMISALSRMQQFVSKGYGVVIGEYGALPGSDLVSKDNAAVYHQLFLDCCTAYDYTSCLWDTSGFFVRESLSFADEEMAQVYLNAKASESDQAGALADMEALQSEAPESFSERIVSEGESVAWIMWNDGGWALSYSVGDTYDPDSISPGIVAQDALITGQGTYTVSLDFTGTQQGYSASTAFCAVGLSNGEVNYPGYCIKIQTIMINGERYSMKGRPYTTSDDGICTRVNLFNEWVTKLPDTARTPEGNTIACSPTLINRNDEVISHIETISVTFEYVPGK